MPKKLTQIEIEKLEFVHFERIRYYFLDNLQDILTGLHSRQKKMIGFSNSFQPRVI